MHPSVQITLFPLCCNSNLLIFLALDSVIQCICHLPWKLVVLGLEKYFISIFDEETDRNAEIDTTQKERLDHPSTVC